MDALDIIEPVMKEPMREVLEHIAPSLKVFSDSVLQIQEIADLGDDLLFGTFATLLLRTNRTSVLDALIGAIVQHRYEKENREFEPPTELPPEEDV